MGKHIVKDRKRRGEAEATWQRRQKIKSVSKDGRRIRREERNRFIVRRARNKEKGKVKKGAVKKRFEGTVREGKARGGSRIQRKARGSERRGSRTRVQNRCVETGYSRSVQRWFRRSVRRRREKARRGELPSVTSRSW